MVVICLVCIFFMMYLHEKGRKAWSWKCVVRDSLSFILQAWTLDSDRAYVLVNQ